MKKTDVENLYTAKVAELLNEGWRIHTSSMPGHQGEIAHIDLTNGSEIRRVLLCREMTRCCNTDGFEGHTLSILVGRSTDRIWPGWDNTVWNSRLEVLSEIELAEIHSLTARHREGWYTDMDTANAIQHIRDMRWRARRDKAPGELGTAQKSVGLRWLRRQPRMKTTRLEDITRMTRYTTSKGRVGFRIEAKGKTFSFHA